MKYFITGGAGFIGSNMVERLLNDRANEVVVFDNFCSGSRDYLAPYIGDKRFRLVEADLLELTPRTLFAAVLAEGLPARLIRLHPSFP